MATFDSSGFSERGRGNGALFPVHGARAKFAILLAPGGTKIYLQILGDDAAPLDIPARVSSAQLSALRGKVGRSGSLDYTGGVVTATLVNVSDVQEVKKDVDYYFCTLSFLI